MKSKYRKILFLTLSFFLCFYLFIPKIIYAGNCTNPEPASRCTNDSDCLEENECIVIVTRGDGSQFCECRLQRPKKIKLPGNYTIEFPWGLNFTDLGSVISKLLPYLYVIAGLILFGAIIISGFQFLFSAGDPKKTAGAKGCLTNAIIGFLIVFLSWWLIQIIEVIFHLDITGG